MSTDPITSNITFRQLKYKAFEIAQKKDPNVNFLTTFRGVYDQYRKSDHYNTKKILDVILYLERIDNIQVVNDFFSIDRDKLIVIMEPDVRLLLEFTTRWDLKQPTIVSTQTLTSYIYVRLPIQEVYACGMRMWAIPVTEWTKLHQLIEKVKSDIYDLLKEEE